MSMLKIDLASLESIKIGIVILNAIIAGGGKLVASALHTAEDITGRDLNSDGHVGDPLDDPILGGEDNAGSDDGLGDLFGEEEPTGPTIDSVKDAITDLAKAKGRDAAKSLITKALAKLKVGKLEEVPMDKYSVLIEVLKKATA